MNSDIIRKQMSEAQDTVQEMLAQINDSGLSPELWIEVHSEHFEVRYRDVVIDMLYKFANRQVQQADVNRWVHTIAIESLTDPKYIQSN